MSEQAKKKFSFAKLRLSKNTFKKIPLTAFLVVCLIFFAFALGMLTNKVIYLEQQLKNPANTVAAAQGAQPVEPTAAPVIKNLSAGKLPLLGNKNAKVTIVEFSDFQCPFCKSYFDQADKQLKETYVNTGKVKFAYRHFPLSSIHPNAQKAAEAAECANDQGKFWEYHDLLFAEQDIWSPLISTDASAKFTTYAGQLGLDTSAFASCLDSDKMQARIAEDNTDAIASQVNATPSFFINGVRLTGAVPFADFQKIIEEELKK